MFLFSLKSLKGKLILLAAVVAAAAIVFAVISDGSTADFSSAANSTVDFSASTEEERLNFITQLGFTVSQEPDSVREVTIPEEFNETYTQYNLLQQKCGLDLEPYKGCKVKKWTYTVTNYPEYEDKQCIRINLLVYKGKIIGGDICNIELDGFMNPLIGEQKTEEIWQRNELTS